LDISLLAVLRSNDTLSSSLFGDAVSTSGDTIVVGDYMDDKYGTDSGATYVFVRDGLTWIQQAYLKGSNTEAGDQFGRSVSISGETIVVGAIGEDSNATGVNGTQTDNSATDSGAAYVFVRVGTIWTQQAYLKASNTGAGDHFGFSVSISEDTIVVGARYEDSNATGVNGTQADDTTDSGAAYVFVRDGTSWTHQAYIKASNTGTEDRFGSAVSISGNTIVVATYAEDSSATGVNGTQTDNSADNSGAAYIFVREGTTWAQQAYLKASNTREADWFGYSVSISGDTIVVGAYGEDSNDTEVNGDQNNDGAEQSGAAYVFVRNNSIWTQQAYLKASNTEAGDHFGFSVSISGDTIVVGARWEDSSATGVNGMDYDVGSTEKSGAAYVFGRDGGSWTQQAYLKPNVSSLNIQFGRVVAVGEFIVVGEDRTVTVFGSDGSTTGTTGTTATTATTATTGTTGTTATTAITATTDTTATTATTATTGTTAPTATTEPAGTSSITGDVMLCASGTDILQLSPLHSPVYTQRLTPQIL
jgi:hypothetical protein